MQSSSNKWNTNDDGSDGGHKRSRWIDRQQSCGWTSQAIQQRLRLVASWRVYVHATAGWQEVAAWHGAAVCGS